MKPLVAYYSRTGTTKKVAQVIADNLKCDIEEIVDTKNRKGLFGYLKSGFAAATKKLTTIRPTQYDPAQYDIIILGTPIWASNITPAIRTYITQNKMKFKRVVFFATYGGSGVENTFKQLEKLCGQSPVNKFDVKTEAVKKNTYIDKVKDFANKIK